MIIKRLNRYTSLPVLMDLLKRKKLVLLDPNTWDDKNDTEIILEYKKRKNIEKLFALCFSYGQETIHHWKTYSDGISGCCIEFNAQELIKILNSIDHLRKGKVSYKKINDINEKSISTNKIPFTKRWPYRCETEYRILWEGNTKKDYYEIDVPLTTINKITVSQKMPRPVYNTIKKYLREVVDDPDKRINRSTIYENMRWINKFKNA